jgi:hypothetical protein
MAREGPGCDTQHSKDQETREPKGCPILPAHMILLKETLGDFRDDRG